MAKFSVPSEVSETAAKLAKAGFEAFLVGGCVRDLLLGRTPKDWDIATNAKPDEIQKIFEDTVYENEFGTVGVKTESEDPKLKVIEVTTYRIEGKYTDKRHPDEVAFAKTIQEDLSRRDFTVNAMAMGLDGEAIDPYEGQKDLKKKIIRTVGSPEARFHEDALRLMRAVRFAVELDFEIEVGTRRAIEKYSRELEVIAKERIRDELVKIIMTPNAAKGIILLEELGLLQNVLPELCEGIGVEQNLHHIYTVFEHNVRALDYSARENYSLAVRIASLLHDVGKPKAKQGSGPNATFYNHEHIGAKMAAKALDRLRFPREFVEDVVHLVQNHMFYYNVGDVTAHGVRRFLARVGPETVPDLLKVREADRIGSGVKKAVPYKLRHLLFMIEKVKNDPISPKMLKVNGDDVMRILKLSEGMRVGWIIIALLEEVLEDPGKNTPEHLEKRMKELNKLSDAELKKLAARAREMKDEFAEEAEAEIKKKFHVQ
jgi:tRNA nucleotidyltransferase (CCA-adding enzyme)